MQQAQIAIASFIGVVGLAIAGWGFTILADDTPPFQPWVAPLLVIGGLVSIAVGALWLVISARRKNHEDGAGPIIVDESTSQEVSTDITGGVVESDVITAGRDVHIYQAPVTPAGEHSITYWHNRPSSLRERFFGRGPKLDEIAEAFKSNETVVLSGGAGYGKSQLAAEYSYRAGCPGFWSIAGADVEQTLAGLSDSLDVRGRNEGDIAAEVSLKLAGLSPETLWIVDNVEDITLVNRLANRKGQVRLLTTTRDLRGGSLTSGAFVPLEVLDEEAAVDLLCSRSETDHNDPHLPQVAEAVGYLPMALEMLASRLDEFGTTPEGLLNELREAANPIGLETFTDQESIRNAHIERVETVYNTIAGTLDRLPADMRQQVSPLGYVADAPLSRGLLMALAGLDEDGLTKLVAECRRHSVMSAVGDHVAVHALTAAAIAATNSEDARVTAFQRTDTRLLATAQSDFPALRDELGHYESVHDRCRDSLPEDDIARLYFSGNLANGYYSLGRYQEAIALYEQTLTIMERVLGLEHPDTLGSRNNLANGYRDLGRYEEAIALDEQTLRIRERLLGPEHPDTLTSRNNLANGYYSSGRHEEAIGLYEQTLTIRERVLGPEHPYTLRSRNNLASGYRAVGRDRDADELERKNSGDTA